MLRSEVPELLERVKIVHFPVWNGDCTLILIRGRDTFQDRKWHALSILIDTGETREFQKRWAAIWSEIKCEYDKLPEFYKSQAGLKPKLDYFIISHFDSDHARHAGELLKILKQERDEEKNRPLALGLSNLEWAWVDDMFIVDRLSTATILPRVERGRSNREGYVEQYQNQRRSFCDTANFFPLAGVLPIQPDMDLLRISQTFDLANFEMVCVAANGFIGPDRKIREKNEDGEPRGVTSLENDLGLAFVLRFGSFRLYTGGDLTGTDGKPREDGTFRVVNSMEVPLVKHLKKRWNRDATQGSAGFDFHACVALLHHHGSDKSTFGDFINFFNPRLAVCSAKGDYRPRKRFPSKEVIERFRKEGALVPLYTDRESTPEQGSYGPKEPRGPLGPCTPLFTCRVNVGFGSGQPHGRDPSTFGEPELTKRAEWRHAFGQDVIIEVTEEKGHSPLVSKEYPRMRAFRRLRNVETYDPVDGLLEPVEGFDQGVTCMVPSNPKPLPERSHEILELLPKGKTP